MVSPTETLRVVERRYTMDWRRTATGQLAHAVVHYPTGSRSLCGLKPRAWYGPVRGMRLCARCDEMRGANFPAPVVAA